MATTKATLMNMRGRDMPGWLRVSSDDLRSDDQLARWIESGTGYARSLPPKQKPVAARPYRRLARPP
jgi:hypothetical protein